MQSSIGPDLQRGRGGTDGRYGSFTCTHLTRPLCRLPHARLVRLPPHGGQREAPQDEVGVGAGLRGTQRPGPLQVQQDVPGVGQRVVYEWHMAGPEG